MIFCLFYNFSAAPLLRPQLLTLKEEEEGNLSAQKTIFINKINLLI